MRDYLNLENKLRFTTICDGDCFTCADGEMKDGKLLVPVTLTSGSDVFVNEKSALKKDGLFEITLELDKGENIITAKNADETLQIKVFVLEDGRGYSRISVDDNIIFLWDITKNKDVYTSIFENPYLAVYKKAHDLYGVCVHLNLFYQTPAVHPNFSVVREDFNLSMMTGKFKDEWIANSDWLKLNFHSLQEKPDKPYEFTDYDTIYNDCKNIQEEIIRFAGEQTLSDETTVHWGECSKEGILALRDRGIKSLAGYFTFNEGETFVSYFYPKELVAHIEDRDFWFDNELDVFFGKIDFVLNTREVKNDYISLLDDLKTKPTRCGYIDLMIHEQYYYEDYCNYIPTFEKIIVESSKWLKENGYKPAFLGDLRP